MASRNIPLIPRKVLFGNPDKASPQLSYDGKRLAFLAPVKGVLNVWVGSVNDLAAAKPVTKDTYRGIRIYLWAYTNRHILYLQDKAGDENWRIYATSLDTGETKDLTPFEGVQARIQHCSPKFPEKILVGLNNRVPQFHDIHQINILTGEMSLVQKNPDFSDFVTDDNYNVRFASRFTPDGGNEIFKLTDDGSWKPFMKISMEDTLTTGAVGFDKTGMILYMVDSRNRDTSALIAFNLETGNETTLAENPRVDVSNVMMHPTEKHVQAVSFNYERESWHILDNSIEGDFSYLNKVAQGDMNPVSRTLDDKHWVVLYIVDNGPVHYYYYDRAKKKAQFLFSNRKELEGLPLAKMHPVAIKSRDGLDLVSYLTTPQEADSEDNGIPDKPLPLVLVVHGGPWGRDTWGYDSMHQWLANRGYAVLSVNFRGSTGFGKKFINAGNMEWAGKMHDDLIDAVQWAIEKRIAEPKHVAIMGGSFGGYATLVGLTFTPETFACGVDIVGPSNLVTLLKSIPPYWAPQVELFKKRVGDHTTEEGKAFLRKRSPLTYAKRIKRPLLIGQGANDPRVKQAESDQIVKTMQKKGIPVTYVLYPDEGHGFARPENRLSFFAVSEAFLAECLGGRLEPVGNDLKGSTITVPVGTEYVPGLLSLLQQNNA